MKAIIIGTGKDGLGKGEGVYQLVAEDGEGLCSHLCSSAGYAEGDLFRDRPERKEIFDKKGITEFVWIENSGMTMDEIVEKNKEFNKEKEKK